VTSFEGRSMDHLGRKLLDAFKLYMGELHPVNCELEQVGPLNKQIRPPWKETEDCIMSEASLSEAEKKGMVAAAENNTEAELIIEEVIGVFPKSCYPGVLGIASQIIEDFNCCSLEHATE
jgi:hypothetical protein